MRWVAITCAGAVWCAAAAAQQAQYFDNEVILDGKTVRIRSAFEIGGPAHRWYALWQQFRLDAQTPLKLAGGAELIKKWGDLFTPENVPAARWSECRGPFTFAEIEAAANLPRGKRTALWATSYVWDTSAGRWVDTGGWAARSALIVTTDAQGKIIKAQTFYAPPLVPLPNHATQKIAVRNCRLALQHLKPKAGMSVYRAVGLRHESHNILLMGDRQAPIESRDRGYFFEPIDTPAKAIELAQLAYPRAVIVKTAQQYTSIIASLRKIGGWDERRFVSVSDPEAYGVRAEAEGDMGWRVTMLAIPRSTYLNLGLRSVTLLEFMIATDGRMGLTSRECIVAPQTPYGAPPGWRPEFGVVGEGRPDPEAAIRAWNEAIRGALAAQGSEILPTFIEVQDQRANVPCHAQTEARWYLNDIDQWPAEAGK